MSDKPAELKGPDLEKGVALESIPDGGMLLGHAGGEGVLIARSGDRCFAIGATCTHYSGPLAEGVFDGECVRCPWHHARFDVRSGDAVGAPALNPVSSWKLEQRGGQVVVLGKATPPAPAPVADPQTVVIVGGGAAGHACAERLRREGHSGKIILLSADAAGPVDRPNLSKDYLAGNAPEEWIPLRGDDYYAEQKIELRTSTRVTGIDRAKRQVSIEGGEAVSWDALVLATGAAPIQLPIAGAELPHVHYLRTLADSRAIISEAVDKKRAVVIGASFIGLEVAASLRARGVEVHVVAPEEVPLARVLGPEVGAFLRALHEEKGVVFHLGKKPGGITAGEVTLESGERIAADFVVIGAGVRPSVQLAAQAGLAVGNGILVDEYLQTSEPGIWAAGDAASWPDARSGERIRVEHWVVAQRMGQTVARNLVGQRRKFEEVPVFWSQHYDFGLLYVGHAGRWDRLDLVGSLAGRDATISYREKGRVMAIATVGRDVVSLRAELAMERGDEGALESLAAG
jgi:NADPH-dependent 2,4-dienoyl-CoA reductase/sulfur reductase-like enzyme/nitrite reductase/ring-hydroxylating ferredoxin subunit